MAALLEFRERLKLIWSKNEFYLVPIAKFILAFVALRGINNMLGYMSRLNDMVIVLVVSLLCALLPVGFIAFFAAVFSLLHMYVLSMEVALVGLCLYLILFFLFLRFGTGESLTLVLTPIAFALNIPYVIPICVGLLGTPVSVVPVGCGIVVYYFLTCVTGNAGVVTGLDSGDVSGRIRVIIDAMIGNETMMVFIVAFAATIIVVYLIRRLSVDYAWSIAMVSGAVLNVLLLLVGDLWYDTNMSMFQVIVGTLIALLFAVVIQFFRFCVDYNRVERVQYEDDEYYYYVKAVPKMNVAMQTKRVKKISNGRSASRAGGRRQYASGIDEEYGENPEEYEEGYEEGYEEDYGEEYEEDYNSYDSPGSEGDGNFR